MKWLVNGELYACAWEAADCIAGRNEAVNIAYRLERMYDGEETDYNGYTVTSYVYYEE